ncbi:hypothetical protein LTR36_000612 [Oleoguttula mirabilis]|uniref:Uncharacterized protein n=1 Tax=Oleoguttula mirabilis TaxID=1507867 RepID=A0AAV9JRP1_9PEZI|nr:hypothetical protein LTR36_000612 [Oleoguttula mirabilis]
MDPIADLAATSRLLERLDDAGILTRHEIESCSNARRDYLAAEITFHEASKALDDATAKAIMNSWPDTEPGRSVVEDRYVAAQDLCTNANTVFMEALQKLTDAKEQASEILGRYVDSVEYLQEDDVGRCDEVCGQSGRQYAFATQRQDRFVNEQRERLVTELHEREERLAQELQEKQERQAADLAREQQGRIKRRENERREKDARIAQERREKEARLAEEQREKEARLDHERRKKEERLAHKQRRKEARLAQERREKEARLAEEQRARVQRLAREREERQARVAKERKEEQERLAQEARRQQQAKAHPTKTANEQLAAWRDHATVALQDYANLHVFPSPPTLPCVKREAKDCPSRSDAGRLLQACDCIIRKAFCGVSKQALKLERLRWHPDKFARCPEAHREVFKKMAGEVFVVLDDLYQKAR